MHDAVSILLSLRRLVTWAIMDLPWRILHKHYKNCFFFKFNVLYIFTKYNYGGSKVKASPCNVEDPGLIPGWGRSPGEGNGNPLRSCWFIDRWYSSENTAKRDRSKINEKYQITLSKRDFLFTLVNVIQDFKIKTTKTKYLQ